MENQYPFFSVNTNNKCGNNLSRSKQHSQDKPVSNELRLIHIPMDETFARKYWKEKSDGIQLEDFIGMQKNWSYIFLVDSNDNIVGQCSYLPLNISSMKAQISLCIPKGSENNT